MFGHLLPTRKNKQARALYDILAQQSRLPAFYTDMGVPDTLDGRYEMQCLLVSLVVIRLQSFGRHGAKLGQKIFDNLFRSAELALREIGIGDLSVPKHMRRMMKGFNGRVIRLHEALDYAKDSDVNNVIEEHLKRNLYSTVPDVSSDYVEKMGEWVKSFLAELNNRELEDFENLNLPKGNA